MISNEIPLGWMQTTLGELVDYGRTDRIEPQDIQPDQWVLELEDIEKDTSKILQRVSAQERTPKSTKNIFKSGDLLYSKLRPYLNKIVIVDYDGVCSTEIIPIKPSPFFDTRYVFYWLKSSKFADYTNEVSRGLNMPRLTTLAGRSAPLLLAPLNEQAKIADKLDVLFNELDITRERLEQVPGLVKAFREAVLESAINGELTRKWRGGSDTKWEEKNLEDVAEARLGKMLDKSKNTGNPTPYLRNVNVRWFDFDFTDISEMLVEDSELEELYVSVDDVLVCEGGEPGRCAVWNGDDNYYVYQKALHRLRVKPTLDPYWLTYCIKHADNCGTLETYFTGTTIKHLTSTSLSKFKVILPSLDEQREAVSQINTLFDFADDLQERYNNTILALADLKRMILNQAFSGKLIPQNHKDESAQSLIKRIKTLREEDNDKRGSVTKPKKSKKNSIEEPARNLDQLIDRLQKLGGKSTPEQLLTAANLRNSEGIEHFFDLLREGRDTQKLNIEPYKDGSTISVVQNEN